jgi:hypothetical protein
MPESEQYIYVCEGCRKRVEPGTRGVVQAFEQVDVSSFGYPETADGLGVLFHGACYPHGSKAYRLA